MLVWILPILYFMLPAYIANMMPVFVKKVCFLDFPIDAGKRFRGYRILGKNKTWRGLVFGVVGALFTVFIQEQLFSYQVIQSISILDYSQPQYIVGFLLGLGALVGDSVKSFFKRQMNIASGKPWFPFDQTDYVIGALLFTSPIYFIGWNEIFFLIISSLILHPLVNYIGYLLKIKKNKF